MFLGAATNDRLCQHTSCGGYLENPSNHRQNFLNAIFCPNYVVTPIGVDAENGVFSTLRIFYMFEISSSGMLFSKCSY